MIAFGLVTWSFAVLMSMGLTFKKVRTPKIQTVSDIREFEAYNAAATVQKYSSIRVRGNFSEISSDHPVVSAVLTRWKANSKPGRRAYGDVHKIALSIEGGGMRGCVSAGATAALNILGLHDTIDVVYGSSAGAMIAAYFISRQFSGVQIYHDILPSAGKRFIDKRKLLYCAGLPRWLCFFIRKNRGTNDGATSFIPDTELTQQPSRNNEKFLSNVINLDFLLVQVMGILQPLDWDIFTKNEASQPLKIVATSLKKFTPVIMSRQNGSFKDLTSLVECIRASMAVPGITGSMMALSESMKNEQEVSNKFDNFYSPFNVHKRSNADHLYETTEKSLVTEGHSRATPQAVILRWIESSRVIQTIVTYIRSTMASLIEWFIRTLTSLNTPLHPSTSMSDSNLVASGMKSSITHMDNRVDKPKKRIGTESSTSDSMTHGSEDDSAHKVHGNDLNRRTVEDCEPIADAFLCEPLPYRSAVDDGASHVIVLRTRPDPCHVLGKGPGVFEKFIATRFFKSYREPDATQWMMELNHHRVYAEDVLRLSEGSYGPKEGVNVNGRYAHLLSIAPSEGRAEVDQLEMRRDKVLTGMQDGARRVFEIFGPSILGKLCEEEIEVLVQSVFPDEMLKRVVSLDDYAKTLVVQEGVDNQI